MSTDAALVTGGAGFVGANLVRRLLAEGHHVVAPVRLETDTWRLDGIAAHLEIPRVDLADSAAAAELVSNVAPRWVFHLAAHGGSSWQQDVQRIIAVNVAGTAALLEAFDGELFVHAGSSSEYGLKNHPAKEDEPLEPNSAYAVTKAAATGLCALHDVSGNGRAITLRLYSAYGPWEDPRRLMPALVGHAREGRLPPLTDPRTARDFVFIDDICDAFLAATRADDLPPRSVLNIAGGREWTLAELVAVARTLFGVTAKPHWGEMADRAWDTTSWVGDPHRASELLGWRASTELEDGLRATAEWMASHGDATGRYGFSA